MSYNFVQAVRRIQITNEDYARPNLLGLDADKISARFTIQN
ncbi:hypothetical protein [Ancylomarina sp. 16SWW S1-10-2]|nr:hypothetical protein [Ancylomarina sp. 16SWW S1-10-2]